MGKRENAVKYGACAAFAGALSLGYKLCLRNGI
jgi:hypothetical protein